MDREKQKLRQKIESHRDDRELIFMEADDATLIELDCHNKYYELKRQHEQIVED